MSPKAKKTPVNHGPCSLCEDKIRPRAPYFGPPKGNDEPPDLYCSAECRDKANPEPEVKEDDMKEPHDSGPTEDGRWFRILDGLNQEPPESALSVVNKGGRNLTYLDGSYVIRRANELFGEDGWERAVVTPPYRLYESKKEHRDGGFDCRDVFACVVRVTIVGEHGALVVREAVGSCDQMGPGSAAAEMAIKGADTDALKRALATLGVTFGLGLKGGAEVEGDPEPEPPPDDPQKAALKALGRALVEADIVTGDGDGVIQPRFAALVEVKLLDKLTKASIHDLVVEHTSDGLVKLIRDRLVVAEESAQDAQEDFPDEPPREEEDEDLA